jgi:site-specific DNA-methyltransferase (adenine-specific)
MDTLDSESVDACVTDPPYHLKATPFLRHKVGDKGFMGKDWDGGDIAFRPETWERVFRILKPGAYLLAFGGTRTYHRMVCAIEDAGFEIRDQIGWLYGSGFAKSHNLKGEHEGMGSALKPAMEPIVVARKPLIGTIAENIAQFRVGALNIDASRIPIDGERVRREGSGKTYCKMHQHEGRPAPIGRDGQDSANRRYRDKGATNFAATPGARSDPPGRWPANIIHDGSDVVVSLFPAEAGAAARGKGTDASAVTKNTLGQYGRIESDAFYADTGSAARFFYCAKESRAEREAGMYGDMQFGDLRWSAGDQNAGAFQSEGTNTSVRNHHPTVKPVKLMRYLVGLVTPVGGVVLDPFTGSGSTGRACVLEQRGFIGCEKELDYYRIAERRVFADSPLFEQSLRAAT